MNGATRGLTIDEMREVEASPIHPSRPTPTQKGSECFRAAYKDLLKKSRQTRTIAKKDVTFARRARAWRCGTLGKFRIEYKGTLAVDCRTDAKYSWTFKGKMRFCDTWEGWDVAIFFAGGTSFDIEGDWVDLEMKNPADSPDYDDTEIKW